ncbi:hypothetical protein HanIR_Chr13g0637241 [Helianthus annuus]|nr:hypothetical protein HanIR_Chr13g0637241 [Helianthus annuus]
MLLIIPGRVSSVVTFSWRSTTTSPPAPPCRLTSPSSSAAVLAAFSASCSLVLRSGFDAIVFCCEKL